MLIGKDVLSGGTISLLTQALGSARARHRAIAENIENVSTPGYKAKDIVFKRRLQEAVGKRGLRMKTTDPRHLRAGAGEAPVASQVQDPRTGTGPGGNNVEIEEQVAKMQANGIAFATYAQSLAAAYRRAGESIRP